MKEPRGREDGALSQQCPSRTSGPSPQLWAHPAAYAQDAQVIRGLFADARVCVDEREAKVVKQGGSGQ